MEAIYYSKNNNNLDLIKLRLLIFKNVLDLIYIKFQFYSFCAACSFLKFKASCFLKNG